MNQLLTIITSLLLITSTAIAEDQKASLNLKSQSAAGEASENAMKASRAVEAYVKNHPVTVNDTSSNSITVLAFSSIASIFRTEGQTSDHLPARRHTATFNAAKNEGGSGYKAVALFAAGTKTYPVSCLIRQDGAAMQVESCKLLAR